MRRSVALAFVCLLACEPNRQPAPRAERIIAADALTKRYAVSRLSRWELRGRAAGADCGVLIVETAIVLDDSMVDALHYGGGDYDIVKDGIQRFSRERGFAGVAYRDSTDKVWTFGDVDEAGMDPCG